MAGECVLVSTAAAPTAPAATPIHDGSVRSGGLGWVGSAGSMLAMWWLPGVRCACVLARLLVQRCSCGYFVVKLAASTQKWPVV